MSVIMVLTSYWIAFSERKREYFKNCLRSKTIWDYNTRNDLLQILVTYKLFPEL